MTHGLERVILVYVALFATLPARLFTATLIATVAGCGRMDSLSGTYVAKYADAVAMLRDAALLISRSGSVILQRDATSR
jgi:hypothetical protein